MIPHIPTAVGQSADSRPHDECEAFAGGCAFDRLDPAVQNALIEHYLPKFRPYRIPPPSSYARRRLPAVTGLRPVAPRMPPFPRPS